MNRIVFILLISLIVLAGCSTTRSVPDNDHLYRGHKIKWKTEKPRDNRLLEAGLDDKIRPRPNKRFLGMPFRLWFYNLGKKPKGKGLNYLLRVKWGEPPVLLSAAKPAYTSEIMQSYLQDNGFFQAAVAYEIKYPSRKKAVIEYSIDQGGRYIITSVNYELDSSQLGKAIKATMSSTLLKQGALYSLQNIKAERERISTAIRDRGYYYFLADHLLVEVDTTHHGKVALYLKIKNNIPESATRPHKMNQVILYPSYSLETDSLNETAIPVDMGHYKVSDPFNKFLPKTFEKFIFLREDSLYRVRGHNFSLQRLMSLGTFKFLKTEITSDPDSATLDAKILMTPYPRYGLELELSGNSKSNNFVGTQVSLTLLNRNWMKRANRLEFKLAAGTEWQVGGKKAGQINTNGYSVDGEIEMNFPGFVIPFIKINPRSAFVPRTKISAGYELLSRPNLYNLNSMTVQMGYTWRQNRYSSHELIPFSLSYVQPGKTTSAFKTILLNDPALRQSIEKQFIIGSQYNYIRNTQPTNKKTTYYLSGNIDMAGNVLGLLINKADDGQNKLFNNPFSQYVRVTGEGRLFRKLNPSLTWANRLLAGYGYSYGNSISLPFVKQYFIGGSNSIRAFRARTLGPGSYQSQLSSYIANESGDIRLEANTELRIKLLQMLEGAVFADAGNIWLQRENPEKPGGKFIPGNILGDLGVGAGIGVRIDASILILRFDLATPIRKPWLPKGDRWVLDQINLGNSEWRRENLILNIAIGYPF